MTDSSPRTLRLALWAQRQAHVVPKPLRRMAGRTLRLFTNPGAAASGPSEDWSVPLVRNRGGGDLEALRSPATDTRRSSPPPTAEVTERRQVRCAVAVGVLDVGGAEEVAAFLARRLPAHAFETVVVYADTRLPGQEGEGGRLASALAAEGVATQRLTPEDAGAWMRSWRPDVVSAHNARDWLLDAATEAGVPWVETLHDMHRFYHPESWAPEAQRARRVSAQIAVSDLVRQQYLARVPTYPGDRVVTVPNGVDGSRVLPVDRAQARAALGLTDEFLFVSLSRYCLQKNTFGLVAAFSDVAAQHPDAHLLVAGRANDDLLYYEQTRQLAASLPGTERIHLRGHCANPSALLAAADAFVLDSFFEGWSLSSMEALVAGVPVVLTDVGGAREQLGDGRRGHLVANPAGNAELVDWPVINDLRYRPQGNRPELVSAMSSMIRERAAWTAARPRLRDEAIRLFSPDESLAGHARVLRAVALGEPVSTHTGQANVG
ncbi:glycosyltransferase [Micromonospora narathiwatensis]|uniref:Glycosyltransferase involved in cell wall bisynthesis n=1 Tax=Micromonospora narathiwatensis TaxID=299146 RepID=A0A1A9AG58_9ACTN|nr:glycosyltransferase [Micromonospora narathiwatensis]SBT55146.1 Glycosyltransferase involved in cell wall bisynthesis [Micromonospora narathiwatensis]